MPELRQDPISGRWVVLAPERAKRPSDFKRVTPVATGGACPFCHGGESMTPPEIVALRPAGSRRDGPGWHVRVFPNRYPALRVEGELRREGEGFFDRMTGVGAHEVVVESARHEAGWGELSAGELEDVLWVWSERMRDLSRDERLRVVLPFKNQGAEAGATLAHPHSQLIALPIVPTVVAEELAGTQAHWARKERCLFCDIVREERRSGARVVLETEEMIAFCPWAARSPFETWVLPKTHESHFEHGPRARVRAAAEILRAVVRRLDVALERPAFNLLLHSSPLRSGPLAHFHWHVEIVPVFGRQAGFEWASGYHINPVMPEEAAAFLRGTNA